MIEDQIKELVAQRDCAIKMLAEWCVAVDKKGTGWDEYYKDAAYRPCLIRELIDFQIKELNKKYEKYEKY